MARAGPVKEQVRLGLVEPTHDPVNVDVRVPEPKTQADTSPDLAGELNRLRAENERLAAANQDLAARVAALTDNLKARDASLGKQTEEIGRLTAACAEYQADRDLTAERAAALEADNARLRADLEAATAPDPKKSKQTKATA